MPRYSLLPLIFADKTVNPISKDRLAGKLNALRAGADRALEFGKLGELLFCLRKAALARYLVEEMELRQVPLPDWLRFQLGKYHALGWCADAPTEQIYFAALDRARRAGMAIPPDDVEFAKKWLKRRRYHDQYLREQEITRRSTKSKKPQKST